MARRQLSARKILTIGDHECGPKADVLVNVQLNSLLDTKNCESRLGKHQAGSAEMRGAAWQLDSGSDLSVSSTSECEIL